MNTKTLFHIFKSLYKFCGIVTCKYTKMVEHDLIVTHKGPSTVELFEPQFFC